MDFLNFWNLGSTSMPMVGLSPKGDKVIGVNTNINDIENMMRAREKQVAQELEQRKAEQKAYQEKQEKEAMLEYNSPKAQVERYKEAGLNPYYQNISAGEYGSALNGVDYSNISSNSPRENMSEKVSNTIDQLGSVVGLINNTVTAMSSIDAYNYSRSKDTIKASEADRLWELEQRSNTRNVWKSDAVKRTTEINKMRADTTATSLKNDVVENGMTSLDAVLDTISNILGIANKGKKLLTKGKKKK